jgi:hypothetical protein
MSGAAKAPLLRLLWGLLAVLALLAPGVHSQRSATSETQGSTTALSPTSLNGYRQYSLSGVTAPAVGVDSSIVPCTGTGLSAVVFGSRVLVLQAKEAGVTVTQNVSFAVQLAATNRSDTSLADLLFAGGVCVRGLSLVLRSRCAVV